MKNLIFTLMMICCVYGALGAKRIAFLQEPGMAEPQVGLVQALTDKGYIVDISYTPFDYTALAGYDLVIIGRATHSSAFTEYASWNSMNVPVMVLSAWAIRDSKLKLINGSAVSNADGALIDQALVTNALPMSNDVVFDGVTTGGAAFPYVKWFYDFVDYYASDFATDKNTGKVLAVLPDDAEVGAGAVVMARWEPGKEAYPGSGILAGYRTYMNIGADDDAGIVKNFDSYTSASLKLFMNEVAFLMDPPAVAPKKIAFLQKPGMMPYSQVIGLSQALKNKGYSVDTLSSVSIVPAALAAYDLVIVSRAVSSGAFTDAVSWNSLDVPVMVLSAWCVSDQRLKLINIKTGVVATPDGSLVDKALVTNALPVANGDGTYDAVFNGVTTAGAAFPFVKWFYDFIDYRPSDFVTNSNTGKVLAVLADDAGTGAGTVMMARWEPGTETYPDAGVHANYRTFMNLGADEDTGLYYNVDGYTDASLKLFLNEVSFLMNPSTVGVRDLKSESKFKVYPIPSFDGNFTIEMKGSKSGMANVQIYTITGMQVYNKDFEPTGSISINSGLTKGMYLLQVNADGNKSSQKIVIN